MNTIDNAKDRPAGAGGFFRWQPAAWLRVSGDDAFAFLQGQFSNDLRAAAATGAVYGLWLNQKGRVLADSFVLPADAGAFWVGSYFSPAPVIRERLEAYIVADDVVVDDATASWRGVTVFGDAAVTLASEARGLSGVCFSGRRCAESHVEWVLPAGEEGGAIARLAGWPELDTAEMHWRRIGAWIPAVPTDIGPGELPNEGGLDTPAISYTKGCYLGQEVIARLKSMGQVRRRLLAVCGSGSVPALPAALFQGERKVGELRSAAADGDGFIGLALLSLLNLRKDAALGFAPGDAAGAVMVTDLR